MRLQVTVAWVSWLCALASAPRGAAAEDVDAAISLYRAGRLDRALDAFVRLRASGGGDTESLATICLHLGILRTGAGDTEGAREAFECLLAVRPASVLPEDLGPAVGAVFAEARHSVGEQPLSVVLRAPDSVEAGGSFDVRVGAAGGAAGLVGTTRLTIVSGSERSVIDLRGPGPHAKQLRAPSSAARLELRETLRDRTGWVLAEASSLVRVTSSSPEPSVRRSGADGDEATSPAPITGRWWFWTGIGAVVAGGIVVAMVATSSEGGAEVGAPSIVGDL